MPFWEGTWFAVPIEDARLVCGLIARMTPDESMLGYFFGPYESVPSLDQVRALEPASAIAVRRFGNGSFFGKKWPIIGTTHGPDGDKWPVPPFAKDTILSGIRLVQYDDHDIDRIV